MFPAELIDVRLVSGCEAMLSPATDCCLAASSASSRLESAMAACGSCPTCAASPRLYGVAQKVNKGTERMQCRMSPLPTRTGTRLARASRCHLHLSAASCGIV